MSKPIPRRLLIHSATYRAMKLDAQGQPLSDGYGGKQWAPDVPLDHVRVVPYTQLIITKDNREVRPASMLFYDSRSSGPEAVTFAVDNHLVFPVGGKEYVIVSAEPIYDEHRLHHWEVGLV